MRFPNISHFSPIYFCLHRHMSSSHFHTLMALLLHVEKSAHVPFPSTQSQSLSHSIKIRPSSFPINTKPISISIYQNPPIFLSHQHKANLCLILSKCECHILFPSISNHASSQQGSFSRQNASSFLFQCNMTYGVPLIKPSICMPICSFTQVHHLIICTMHIVVVYSFFLHFVTSTFVLLSFVGCLCVCLIYVPSDPLLMQDICLYCYTIE